MKREYNQSGLERQAGRERYLRTEFGGNLLLQAIKPFFSVLRAFVTSVLPVLPVLPVFFECFAEK